MPAAIEVVLYAIGASVVVSIVVGTAAIIKVAIEDRRQRKIERVPPAGLPVD